MKMVKQYSIVLEEQRNKQKGVATKVVSTAEFSFDLHWNIIVWSEAEPACFGFPQQNLNKAGKRQKAVSIPPLSREKIIITKKGVKVNFDVRNRCFFLFSLQ